MKLSKRYIALTAAAICLGLTGCSDDADDVVHNVRAAPELQGTFADACSSSKLLDTSEQIQLNFEGNDYTRTQIFYGEADCKTETGRIEYKGEFLAGEDSNPQSGGTLNLDVSEVKIKVDSETLAKTLNAINYCGHSDFAAGKEVSLTGAQTAGLCPIENIPVKLYTSYKVENETLWLSDSDITTMSKNEQARTGSINMTKPYSKR